MQAQTQAPPPPPAPPSPVPAPIPINVEVQTPMIAGGPGDLVTNPVEILRAFKVQRDELRNQQSELQDQRRSIANRLREGKVEGADKAGLESRLVTLDQQVAELDKQIATSNLQVAKAAAVPGSTVPDMPVFDRGGPPEAVFVLSGLFIVTVFFPLAIAMARRIWRRSSPASAVTALPPVMTERMARIEDAVEAIAVEVERVGEGQRYLTRLLASGPAEPMAVPQRESLQSSLRESLRVK
jgi:hypothetical protein